MNHSRPNESTGDVPLPIPHVVRVVRTIRVALPAGAKTLASQIERQLRDGAYNHYAVYEDELKRLWPLNDPDREAKIAHFAKSYGFRLRFYREGLCAIFDEQPSPKADVSPQVKRHRSAPTS